MSWNDYYRRRDALDAVVDYTSHTHSGEIPYDEVPEARAVFASRDELILALHYRWMLKLTGRLSIATAEADRDPGVDALEAVSQAWRTTAAEFPALRRLVDVSVETAPHVMRPAVDGEHRLLALAAGLTQPYESQAEATRIGAAYAALVRSSIDRSPKRRGTMEVLRKLVAS